MRPVDIIRKVAPGARSQYVQAFEQGDWRLKAAGITTPNRLAHFLAQVLHESGGLTVTFENMNYKTFAQLKKIFGAGNHSAALTDEECRELLGHPQELAERVYGLGNPKKAKELGNTAPGDGYRCRGGGILQTTGGYAYRHTGAKAGVDFYGHPELICSPEYALQPALIEWTEGNLNAYADKNDILAISRGINLGNPHSSRTPNGFSDRKVWFERVRPLIDKVDLVGEAPPVTPAPKPVVPPAAQKGGIGAAIVAAVSGAFYWLADHPWLIAILVIAAVAGAGWYWYSKRD